LVSREEGNGYDFGVQVPGVSRCPGWLRTGSFPIWTRKEWGSERSLCRARH